MRASGFAALTGTPPCESAAQSSSRRPLVRTKPGRPRKPLPQAVPFGTPAFVPHQQVAVIADVALRAIPWREMRQVFAGNRGKSIAPPAVDHAHEMPREGLDQPVGVAGFTEPFVLERSLVTRASA